MGQLNSQAMLILHTYHSGQLFFGKNPDEKSQYSRPGLVNFMNSASKMCTDAEHDNPYADWAILKTEELVQKAKQKLETLNTELAYAEKRIPDQFSVSDNQSVKPARIPVVTGNPIGFHGVFLLIEYDKIVRRILQLGHIGILQKNQCDAYQIEARHIMRSLFAGVTKYLHLEVNRDDMAANNARARDAIEKLGRPPEDVLTGDRRSQFAPPIKYRTRRPDPTPEEIAEDERQVAARRAERLAKAKAAQEANAVSAPEAPAKATKAPSTRRRGVRTSKAKTMLDFADSLDEKTKDAPIPESVKPTFSFVTTAEIPDEAVKKAV
jgi:integrating conjugative element protein (TIGR03761 family)